MCIRDRYYGDEIGMGENIWLDDRHGVRTPMQWSAATNAGFSEAEKTYQPVIDDEEYSYRHLNVAAQETDANSYLNWTRYLVAARQAQPALRAGTLAWVETGYAAVLAFRRAEGDNRVLCVFNLSDKAQPSGIIPATAQTDLLAREGRSFPAGEEIHLSPYECLWLLES